MGFWSWIFGGAAPRKAPPWSHLREPDAFERFAALVVAILEEHGDEATPSMVRSGSVMIGDESSRREWLLHDLSSRCAAKPEAQWKDEIRRSFVKRRGRANPSGERSKPKRDNARSAEENRLVMSPPLDAPSLRVQLMSSDYLSIMERDGLLATPLCEGIEKVLVATLPGGEITLRRKDVAHLGHSDEVLFQGAVLNAIATELDDIVTTEVTAEDGSIVSILVSNAFFMGSCVLRMLEQLPTERAVVSFVSWHHVLIYAIEGEPSLAALEQLSRLVADLDAAVNVTVAERLSTNLFCYEKESGSFVRLVLERALDGRIEKVEPDLGLTWVRARR